MKQAALVVAVIAAMAFPFSQGQSPAPFMMDGQGDAKAYLDGTQLPPAQTLTAGVDLQAVTVAEDAEAIHLTIELDALDPDPKYTDRYELSASFTYEGQRFLIQCARSYVTPASLEPLHACELYTIASTARHLEGPLVASFDGAWTISVERPMLRGLIGTPLLRSHAIADWVFETDRFVAAASRNATGYTGRIHASDRLPDSGNGPAYTILLGAEQSSELYLVSNQPVRYSNGEARTYVFNFTTHNSIPDPGTITWKALDVPNGWEVTIPASTASAAGPGDFSRVAIARVPYMHEHGSEADFKVQATHSAKPDARGVHAFSVYYPAIPQPAGHHDTLFVHAMEGTDLLGAAELRPYMNALVADDSGIDDMSIPATPSSFTPLGGGSHPVAIASDEWRIPLNPGLLVGLFFLPDSFATATLTVEAGKSTQMTQISARLMVERPTQDGIETLHIAQSASTDLGPLMPGDQKQLKLTLPIDSAISTIPGLAEWNLVLKVDMVGSPALGEAPALLHPGASIQMPLLDPIDLDLGIRQIVADVVATLRPGPLLQIIPGKEAEFAIDLVNNGPATRVTLDLVATQEWAFIASEPLTTLPNGPSTIRVGVAMPAESSYGDQVDIILSATIDGVDEPLLVRMTAIADANGEGVQAVERIQVPKETPGLTLSTLVFVIAIALLARSRR